MRNVRRLGLVVVVAAMAPGCFSPSLPAVSCGPNGLCPGDLVCNETNDTCEDPSTIRDGSINVSDAPIDVVDATPPDDAAAALVNTDLLVRYYLDQASAGQPIGGAVDSAPNPLTVPLIYDGGVPTYSEINGNRGLEWTSVVGGGRASIATVGTKIEMLTGNTSATIEVVVQANAVPVQPTIGRFGHIGVATQVGGVLTIGANGKGIIVSLAQGGSSSTEFDHDLTSDGRVVLHAVIDTTEPVPADRVRVYVDGVEVLQFAVTFAIPQGNTIFINPLAFFALGNREQNNASFDGVLFYYAIYTTPMSDSAIANNVAVLQASDDAPP